MSHQSLGTGAFIDIEATDHFLKQWTANNNILLSDTVLDTFPNQLTATSEYLSVVDTAAYLDISYPPLLRPERKVDVIIHLNYSSGSQTKVRLFVIRKCFLKKFNTKAKKPVISDN